MGLDITISRCNVEKCPHCGKPIKEICRAFVDSCGFSWEKYLIDIGYYLPYEILKKEPERDSYGKDMKLTTEQAKDIATFAREHDLYNWVSIMALVDCAIENGDFVVINADW